MTNKLGHGGRERLLKMDVGFRRYPYKLPDNPDIEELARQLVEDEYPNPEPLIKKTSKIFSTGSCFAQNISVALKEQGYDTFHLRMAEAENSTFATKLLIENRDEKIFGILTKDSPVSLEDMNHRIHNSDCVILTLGVGLIILNENRKYEPGISMSFFNKYSKVFMYMTSVEENVQNINAIISRFKDINPNVNVFITVSPIPLVMGLPNHSAFTTDCISKGIMRTTAHTIMNQGLDNVYYWPSFEIVRWLAGHTGPTFGANEIGSRHVNQDLIDLIISLFIEKFAV